MALLTTAGVALLAPQQARAQDATSGEIFGKVLDDSGNPVAGVDVVLSDDSRGFRATSTTGSDGVFRFARLANGDYVATLGDATRTVRVSAGTVQTLAFTVGSANAKTLEQVVVTGQAATSTSKDYYSQESGINIDIDNLLTRVPVPRNIFSAALLAPGTTAGDASFGNLPSFSGSSVSENVYQINGYNSSDPRRFLGLMNQIPFEFFQQIDVKTGGFQAEYGRATGGIISLVTRSGSNDFTAGSSVFYTPEDLRAHSPDSSEVFNSKDASKNVETNVWAGGALIKDRLFFYGLVNFRTNTIKDFEDVGTFDTIKDNDPFWGLNIDGVLLDSEAWGRHSFTWTHIDDKRTSLDNQDGFDRDSRTVFPGDTLITRNRGGNTDIIKYTGVVRDWLTVSGTYGKSDNVTDTTSNKDANPRILDRRSGSTAILGDSATTTFTPVNANSREEYRFDSDIFLTDLFGFGDHKIRLGFDHENLSSDEVSRRSGNALYIYSIGAVPVRFDPNGVFAGQTVELVTRDRRTTGGSFKTTYEALYAEDRWAVTDRLTLNLGVRSEDGENFAIDGSSFVKLNNQFDFRNGFTFDTFGDGTSRVYGFYGRTHQGVPNNTNVRLAGSEVFVREFFLLNGLNPDDTPITGQFLGEDQVSPLGIQDPKTLVSSTLKAQSQDEYILGFEKTFGLYTFGIKGVYRKLRAGIEDGAMDRGLRQFAADNGLDVAAMANKFRGFNQFILFNPGSDVSFFTQAGNLPADALAFLGGDPDGDGLVEVNLTADQIGVPKQRRRYTAIELTGERAFADGWSLQGSYTWSRLRGNSEGGPKSDIGQSDVGLTQDFDTAGLQINSQGRLPNDRKHNFKLFGAYEVADGFTIGANFTLASPRHFGCLGVLQSDPIASQFGASAFTCDPDGENGPLPTVGTPRGSVLKSEWTKVLDMTFAFTPKLDLPAGLKNPEFRVDIFNILNLDDVTDRQEVGEDPDSGDVNVAFGEAIGFIAPRSVRLSVRMEF
ncbi:MAG: TonB-dependent receptor [Xanthomonadaceae bacterium]|nr:TonB-dependent receptor [Xanthomonadaceae bacterium]MDZ4117181.1 TonB-dependent receptor [Xanthomonadaceae bacterium]